MCVNRRRWPEAGGRFAAGSGRQCSGNDPLRSLEPDQVPSRRTRHSRHWEENRCCRMNAKDAKDADPQDHQTCVFMEPNCQRFCASSIDFVTDLLSFFL